MGVAHAHTARQKIATKAQSIVGDNRLIPIVYLKLHMLDINVGKLL